MKHIHPLIAHLPRQIILLAAITIVTALTGCQTHTVPIDTSSANAIEKDARAHVPFGSTVNEVTAYLADRGIHYKWMQQGQTIPEVSNSIHRDPGWAAHGFPTLMAFIPHTGQDNLKGYALEFRFDHTKSALLDIAVVDVPAQ